MVSSFSPIVKKSDNIKVNNSRQAQFQSKPDTVSFKSANQKVYVEMNKLTTEMEDAYLKNFPDMFGENFEKNFLKPWKRFLSKHGVKISYSKDSVYTPANEFIKKSRRVEDGVAADLVDKNGHSIIYKSGEWVGIKEPVKGVTKNDVTVKLLYNLVHNKMEMNDNSFKAFPNPLQGVKIPDELKKTTDDISMVLTGFRTGWEYNVDDTVDKGALYLKKILIRLMPEKQPAKIASKSIHANTSI